MTTGISKSYTGSRRLRNDDRGSNQIYNDRTHTTMAIRSGEENGEARFKKAGGIVNKNLENKREIRRMEIWEGKIQI